MDAKLGANLAHERLLPVGIARLFEAREQAFDLAVAGLEKGNGVGLFLGRHGNAPGWKS
jgi:hypothetical protein